MPSTEVRIDDAELLAEIRHAHKWLRQDSAPTPVYTVADIPAAEHDESDSVPSLVLGHMVDAATKVRQALDDAADAGYPVQPGTVLGAFWLNENGEEVHGGKDEVQDPRRLAAAIAYHIAEYSALWMQAHVAFLRACALLAARDAEQETRGAEMLAAAMREQGVDRLDELDAETFRQQFSRD